LVSVATAQPALLPAVVATTSGWSAILLVWVLLSTLALAQVRLVP
jgi:hypothetical protein